MEKIKVKVSSAKQPDYTIFIGNGLIEQLASFIDLKKYSKVFVIVDEDVEPLYLKKVVYFLPQNTSQVVLPVGEKSKNIENVQKIWVAMHDAKLDRKSLVLNLGGGVIGDMGGFAASTYMRGMEFINAPTTLLSQVDASVGGKNGIDLAGIKNLIGTFNQPSGVIIDVQTLKTLPKRQFLGGFAEIIKHGLIKDIEFFAYITSKDPFNFSQEELIQVIKRSCEIKVKIVENDESENGQRKLLNFGHTIGHAVEALSLETDKHLLHGEAVSIGMFAEAKISHLLGHISIYDVGTIQQKLMNAGLPVAINNMKTEDIMKKIESDKKTEKGKINWTLLKAIGNAVYDQQVSEKIVTDALHM